MADSKSVRCLDAYLSMFCLHRFTAGSQKIFFTQTRSHSIGRCLCHNIPGSLIDLFFPAEHGKFPARAPFLHSTCHCIDIQRPRLQQPCRCKCERLRRHIVNIAHQLCNTPVRFHFLFLRFSQKCPDAVRLFKFLCPDADPHFCLHHHRHISKMSGKVYKKRCPGRRT